MNSSRSNALAVLLMVLLLSGCAKKQSSNPVDAGTSTIVPGATGTISGAQRKAVITTLQAMMDSVSNVNPSGMRSALLKFFASRPEFQTSGVAPDSSIYAVFTDGRVMIYADNWPYDPAVPIPPLTPLVQGGGETMGKSASTFPGSKDAFIMNVPFAAGDSGYIARSTRWLYASLKNITTKAGYVTHAMDATISNLKLVRNAGLFHIATHGGMCFLPDKVTKIYSLMTGEPFDAGKDTTDYKADFDAHRLTYFYTGIGLSSAGVIERRWNYGITQNFVADYMTFSDNSLAVLTACSSYNQSMIDGFRQANASVYIGWDNTVLANVSDPAAAFIFDRSLGTNLVTPIPNLPQRPFAWQYVIDDLAVRGYTVSHGDVTANLKSIPLKGDLTVLLPSIFYTSFTQNGTSLTYNIQGDFGSVPGQVLLNGIPLSLVKPWKENSLEVEMPAGGGNLQVVVNGLKSNVVQLTQYTVTFTYTEKGPGTLLKKIIANVNFLADIHKYRVVSGANLFYKDEAIFQMPRGLGLLPGAACSYEASGVDKDVSWSGGGSFTNLLPIPNGSSPGGTVMGTINDDGLNSSISVLLSAPFTLTTSSGSNAQTFNSTDGLAMTLSIPVSPGSLMKAGRVTKSTSTSTYTLEWTDFVPRYLPDPSAAR